MRLCSFTVLFSPCRPLLATNREEVGPTAVWLDGVTSGVQGGEGYSAYVGRWVGQDGSSTSGDAVVMRGEKLGRNEVKMVPVTTEGPSTLEVHYCALCFKVHAFLHALCVCVCVCVCA